MKRLLSKSMVVGVVVMVVGAVGVQPAVAVAVGGGHLTMTGTISPDPYMTFASNPLGTFGITHSLAGTGSVVVDGQPAVCNATYTATGTTNLVVGSGYASVDCGVLLCDATYTQNGMMHVLVGECRDWRTGASYEFTATCLFAYVTTIVAADCEFTVL